MLTDTMAPKDPPTDLPAVLALDQGGHASRACIIAAGAEVIAEGHSPVATNHGRAGEVEHDAQDLLDSLRTTAGSAVDAAAAVARTRGARLRIRAAGLATQRSTLVCFDRATGAPLSPAISWQDRRNADWLARFESQRERIRQITGLPLSPHYGVGKMRWCLDHVAAVQAAAAASTLCIAPLAAFLAARLTGDQARVDPANASRTLLWDSELRDWSAPLCELFGIERALLPPCTVTRGCYGRLRHMAAGDATIALDEVPLRALTGDQSAIPFAFGPPEHDTIYINLGTGAFVQRPVVARPSDPAPLLASVLAADERGAQYSLEGTVNGAGSAIAAICAELAAPQESLWQELEQVIDEVSLPVYVNGIGGLGSPYWREQRSYFTASGSSIERFAAVVESIAFLIAINVECMRKKDGEPRRVILTGGLSRSDWLCRRLTAALDLPLLRGPIEATSLGVAALAAHELVGTSAPLTRFDAPPMTAAAREALRIRRALLERHLDATSPPPAFPT